MSKQVLTSPTPYTPNNVLAGYNANITASNSNFDEIYHATTGCAWLGNANTFTNAGTTSFLGSVGIGVNLRVTGILNADGTISAGVVPASVTGNGTAAATPVVMIGATGGATSGVTGQTAGAGAASLIKGGTGGAAPAGSTNGKGGDIVLQPGAAGAGAGTAPPLASVIVTLANVQAAANNAAAAALGVPVGGLYRTSADPSVLCIRSA